MDWIYLFAFVMVCIGSAVSGMAAFGFSLVIVPPLLLAFEPATVTTMVIILTLVTRWVVLVDAWDSIQWPPVAMMAPTGVVGSFAGAYLLKHLDSSYIKFSASAIVVSTSLIMLAGRTIPGAQLPAAPPVAGFFSGMLNTATGMAGPPVVLLFSARDYATQVFRGTLTAFFYFVSIFGLVAMVSQRLVQRGDLYLSLGMLPAALIGTYLGQYFSRRISQRSFRRVVLILLVGTGITGAVAALRSLQ